MDPKDLHTRLIAGPDELTKPVGRNKEGVAESESTHPPSEVFEQEIEALSEFVAKVKRGESFEHLAREYGRSIATVHAWVTQSLCRDRAPMVNDQQKETCDSPQE